MRRIILIEVLCAVLFARLPLLGEEETWLQTRSPENASYFSPKMRVSRLQDSVAIWPGVGIGWILGSVLSIGFEGYFLATDPRGPGAQAQGPLSMAFGGLSLEAVPFPERRTHLSFNVLVGGGGSQLGGETEFDSLSRHGFFFVSPGTKVSFNLTRNIRLQPGVSYLWTPDPVWGVDDHGMEEPMLTLDLLLKKPDPD